MRSIIDVQLLVFFASVFSSTSLVIADKEGAADRQEHPYAPLGRAFAELLQVEHPYAPLGRDFAELLQSGYKERHGHYLSKVEVGTKSRSESSSRATSKVASSSQKAGRRSGPDDVQADHMLADILGNMHVSGFLAKTQVVGSTSDPSLVPVRQSAPASMAKAAPTAVAKSPVVHAAPAVISKASAQPVAQSSEIAVHGPDLMHGTRPVLSATATGRHVRHDSQDHPLKDVMGSLVPSSMSGSRIARFEAWEAESRKQGLLNYVIKAFFSVLIWAALSMMLGLFYHHEKQHPPKLDPEGVNVSLHDRERLDRQRWRFGLFECLEVPSLCLFSVCCAPIRWADTMRMAGFMNFFSALVLVVGLTVLSSISLGLGFVGLVGAFIHFRHRMRQKFYIRGSESYMADVLAIVFCPWCSIVQEARQIEEAYLARHASVRDEYRQRHSAVVWLSGKKV